MASLPPALRLALLLVALLLVGCPAEDPPAPRAPDAAPASRETGQPAASTAPPGEWPLEQPVAVGPEVGYVLKNAERSHAESPDTFNLPPRARREALKEGEIVKLLFSITAGSAVRTERMWVLVKSRDGADYLGTLDNDSLSSPAVRSGLEVRFGARHVIAIYDDAPPEEGLAPVQFVPKDSNPHAGEGD